MTATYRLFVVALRRDRVRLAVWLVVLAGVMAGSAASTKGLYPTRASLEQIARSIEGTRATLALYGPANQLDTVGGIVMWKPGGLALVLAGLLGLLTVVRHTRAEEEVGLAELTGAAAVGRLAPLASALALAALAELGLGLLVGLGLAAGGAGGAGAVGAGLSFAVVGFCFAAVAGVSAQVCATGRAANGLAGAVLAGSYALRAISDSSAGLSRVAWLSPLGWVQRLEPYAGGSSGGPRWWVLLLPLGAASLLTVVAIRVRAGRDLGEALLASRPGPPVAGPRLSGAFGLAWRLQRGELAAWCLGFAALGGLAGWLASSVGTLVGDSDSTRELFERLGGQHGLADAYLAASLSIAGVAASAYAVVSLVRLRTEEEAGRAEPLLAGGVARRRFAASYLTLSLGGSTVLLGLLGLVCGLARAVQTGDAGQLGRVLVAAVALAPGAWLMSAVVMLVVGLLPGRTASLAWAVYGACVLLGPLGAVVGLPSSVQDLSPYTHLPHLPSTSVRLSDLAGLPVLAAVAAVALAVGLRAYRRRDIPA